MKTGIEILRGDVEEFIRLGSAANIVNPQSEVMFEGKYVIMGRRRLLDLTRLDYLALGSEKVIADIMIDCLGKYNLSCPASQVVTKMDSTVKLEEKLSQFHGMAAATIFLNGYAVNENVLQALGFRLNTPHLLPYSISIGLGEESRKKPTIFFVDGESHYSARHGMQIVNKYDPDLCSARYFPSMDYDKLIKRLKRSYASHGDEVVRIIVSDTISSTTGKIFDVGTLCKIALEYDCLLYLDEAHAIGTFGPHGNGVASQFPEFHRYRDRVMIMGTLTKAFCQLGGYVTMPDRDLNQFLRLCCPQYIFSAPLPPWMAEAVISIIDQVSGDFGEARRNKLRMSSEHLREKLREGGFNILGSESHIIPILVGNEHLSAQVKEYLLNEGLATSLFCYPAVPRGESTIRVSLCADIEEEEVEYIAHCFQKARAQFHF